MAAVWEVLLLAAEGGAGDQAEIHPLGQVLWVQRLLGDLADRQGAVRARRREQAVFKFDLVDVGAKHAAGNRLGLADNLFGREMDGRPAERRRTRTPGAFADSNLVGIALQVMHLVGVDAETVAKELLVDGLVALALRDRTRHQGHRAAP